MAALRGTIEGDRTRANSDAVSHRLADRHLTVRADTWNTFARVEMDKDGHGYLIVKRNGQTIAIAEWEKE